MRIWGPERSPLGSFSFTEKTTKGQDLSLGTHCSRFGSEGWDLGEVLGSWQQLRPWVTFGMSPPTPCPPATVTIQRRLALSAGSGSTSLTHGGLPPHASGWDARQGRCQLFSDEFIPRVAVWHPRSAKPRQAIGSQCRGDFRHVDDFYWLQTFVTWQPQNVKQWGADNSIPFLKKRTFWGYIISPL